MKGPVKESGRGGNGRKNSADEADEYKNRNQKKGKRDNAHDRGIAEPPAALTLALCPKLGSTYSQRAAELWISRDRNCLNTSSHSAPHGRSPHFPLLPCVTRLCISLFFHHLSVLWGRWIQCACRIQIIT